MNYSSFDWAWLGADDANLYAKTHRMHMEREIFEENMYEKFFNVEEGDVVLDVGASVGPFTYSILHKKPSIVYCFEPSPDNFPTLKKNVNRENVILINKGISETDGEEVLHSAFGKEGSLSISVPTIRFKTFLDTYKIEKIDFLKTDCESGEYSIFNIENFSWIHANVKKIVGEWHIETPEMLQQFIKFRDLYLRSFTDVKIESVNGQDLSDRLYDDWFAKYFKQIIIYINNTK